MHYGAQHSAQREPAAACRDPCAPRPPASAAELLTCFSFIRQESEGEEAAESRVTLGQNLGRGNIAERQSRVKLQEVKHLVHSKCIPVGIAECT